MVKTIWSFHACNSTYEQWRDHILYHTGTCRVCGTLSVLRYARLEARSPSIPLKDLQDFLEGEIACEYHTHIEKGSCVVLDRT